MLAEADIERIASIVARSRAYLAMGVFGSYGAGSWRKRTHTMELESSAGPQIE
jgi:hypothetical protein